MHRNPFRYGVLFVAGALALQACDARDPMSAAEQPAAPPAASQSETYAAVARALAVSLASPDAARELYDRIHSSRMREDRVDLGTLASARAASGETFALRMDRAAGGQVSGALRQVLASALIDVYFPVPAHRESWKPGQEVLVAYQDAAGEREFLPAYDNRGELVRLSADVAPETPVLVVTRTEGASARAPEAAPRFMVEQVECGPEAFYCGGGGGGGGYTGGGGTPTYTPRYRSAQGYGLAERIIEHKVLPDVEYWFEGGPEPGVSVIAHKPSPYNANQSILTNYVYLHGGEDDPIWYGDNRDLWRWNQEYGDYFTLHFWEDDGGINTGTITIDGHSYGYQRPSSRDDLGQWTYSWNDVSMQYGIDGGHGIGRWGGDTGRIRFVTDYVTP